MYFSSYLHNIQDSPKICEKKKKKLQYYSFFLDYVGCTWEVWEMPTEGCSFPSLPLVIS